MPLSKAQKKVFTSEARFRVLITGRRFGKTFLALNELAKFSRYPKKVVWYIAPTYRMCKDIMLDPLVEKMTKHKWISKVNYSDLTITLRNKSRIQLRSSENFNALRGVGLDFICVDEFSDVDERAWFEVLRPTLSDKSKEKLILGNLYAKRDWGHARDYVLGMWQILQQRRPDDYVLATGISKTVREFVELAFQEINVKLRWDGSGIDEIGVCTRTGKTIVRVDPRYFRPTEVDSLQGDASKAFRDFGWKAVTSLADMVAEMVRHDLAELHSTSQKT